LLFFPIWFTIEKTTDKGENFMELFDRRAAKEAAGHSRPDPLPLH
jgi:hypothetical protein